MSLQQQLMAMWPDWHQMPERERVARIAAIIDAPEGLSHDALKCLVNETYEGQLEIADAIISEVKSSA